MSTTDLPDDDTLETLSEEGYTSRKPTGALKYLYYAIGLGMAAFHIWFLGYSSMEPWALYYSHICFGVVLAYFLYPFSRRSNKRKKMAMEGRIQPLVRRVISRIRTTITVEKNRSRLVGATPTR